MLDGAEVRQAERGHLLALPVLLEPAARVLADVEAQHDEPRDRRDLERQAGRLIRHGHWPFAAYAASVASLTGRHQSSWAWYHSMVAASPASKSWYVGCQPSSWRSLPDSIA